MNKEQEQYLIKIGFSTWRRIFFGDILLCFKKKRSRKNYVIIKIKDHKQGRRWVSRNYDNLLEFAKNPDNPTNKLKVMRTFTADKKKPGDEYIWAQIPEARC